MKKLLIILLLISGCANRYEYSCKLSQEEKEWLIKSTDDLQDMKALKFRRDLRESLKRNRAEFERKLQNGN